MLPEFVQGSEGAIHLSLFLPQSAAESWVICFPPFAEEMNKSRNMMSAQARAWSSAGIAVVIPDLHGTGDSDGDFLDANWDTWRTDMCELVAWIRTQGGTNISFWGIRLGCLLALDVNQRLDQKISGFVFWQPVINGLQAVTQFLRLRMAASVMGGTQEKVSDLRTILQKEGQLEVGGYFVSANLMEQIDRLSMQEMVLNAGVSMVWLEISANTEKPLPVNSRKIIEGWQRAGVAVTVGMVEGDKFWMTQEISMVPELILRSMEALPDDTRKTNVTRSVNWPNLDHLDHRKSSSSREYSTHFSCHGETLPAVIHRGEGGAKRGVLLVVGGPQYRIGSHRQFVLLARRLAEEGIPVLRFDYRGMGDASGTFAGFEAIHDDIRGAVDCFQSACLEISEVVIWGLCDAATAASFYAADDCRIRGLVLINPWVRSTEGEAKAYLRYYFLRRLFSQDLWGKVFSGRFDVIGSLKSLLVLIRQAVINDTDNPADGSKDMEIKTAPPSLAFRMEQSLKRFNGKVLIMLSGNDLTAAEFNQAVKGSSSFSKIFKQKDYRVKRLVDADHTFSKKKWRDIVILETVDWIKSW